MIWTLFLIQFLAVASPGPDFLVTVQTALGGSRRALLVVSLGIVAANAIHIAYCLAGLGLLISQSIFLFSVFKFLGAAYLLFLGISAFLSKKSTSPEGMTIQKKSQKTFVSGLKSGFLVSILNPKAALYYATLFSVFLDPSHFSLEGLSGILFGFLMIVFGWFLLVGFVLSIPHISRVFLRFRRFFDRIFGAILIFFGVWLFSVSHR